MNPFNSQNLESFVPVYDVVPEEWKDARPFLVEHLKKISNAVNIREIGWFLDEELLSGKAFYPGGDSTGNESSPQFRQILRIVINCSPLVIGLNTFPHNITVDANFTLIDMFGAATNHSTFTGEPLPNGLDTLSYDTTNVYVTVAAAWDTAYAVMEYIQEL